MHVLIMCKEPLVLIHIHWQDYVIPTTALVHKIVIVDSTHIRTTYELLCISMTSDV